MDDDLKSKTALMKRAIEGQFEDMKSRPSLFDENPDWFDIFVDDEKLPLAFPAPARFLMTKMHMAILPGPLVREIIEGEADDFPGAYNVMLRHLLGKGRVVRFGGRTPHDAGEVIYSTTRELAWIMRNSERAMEEAWAWVSRRGYLPVTFHMPFPEPFTEFRIQLNRSRIRAASISMYGLQGDPYVVLSRYNTFVDSLRGSRFFEEPELPPYWIDGAINKWSNIALFDLNVDDGSCWPGWHVKRPFPIAPMGLPEGFAMKLPNGLVRIYEMDWKGFVVDHKAYKDHDPNEDRS